MPSGRRRIFGRMWAFMRTFSKELQDSGVFVSTEGLGWPSEAKLVRAGKNGEPITDGVFPESKEFLAGYRIIDVQSPEQVRKSLPTSRFGITDPRQNRSASSKAASTSLFHCSWRQGPEVDEYLWRFR